MIRNLPLLVASATVLPTLVAAQSTQHPSPIADALAELGPDVQVFEDHLVTLSNPFMEGRLPGTRGMEIAKEYCEHYLRQAGLEPGFETEDGLASWRQPFPLGGKREVTDANVRIELGDGGGMTLVAGKQFNVLGNGRSGAVESAPMTFIGYGIEEGPDGYLGWDEDLEVEGHVLVAFRFEPMDENGKSKWSRGASPWTRRSQWARKLNALEDLRPAAMIFVNPPECADPRSRDLMAAGTGGGPTAEFPVVMIDQRVADELFLNGAGMSLVDARKLADDGPVAQAMTTKATVAATIERKALMAENVGGLLPGRGKLANEIIVMGAHLDHLGMGEFGSRGGAGQLHPGADDNASGSAAVLMLADKLKRAYDRMPADGDARTLLFVLFSGEESGLNGSRYYVRNPIRPLEEHALMCNFDMIGRIKDGRLSVSGTNSAKGMSEWLQPIFEASPLDVVQPATIMAASDHAAFVQKEVPVLFAIIADFHDDYHTPRDVSSMINRVGSVQTVDLFEKILIQASTWPERFEFQRSNGSSRSDRPSRSASTGAKVRFGISPGSYEEGEAGVLVGAVTADTAAAEAGIQAEDRLVSWNGEAIGDVRAWMRMLGKCEPGDVVKVGVVRGADTIEVDVTLRAP